MGGIPMATDTMTLTQTNVQRGENYDYLYERLQKFYELNVVGNYPNNQTLDEQGRPKYRYESSIRVLNFDKACEDDKLRCLQYE